METTATDGPRCTVCHTRLWEHEIGRQACSPCQQRCEENLLALPGPRGLYAALSAAMVPGRAGDGGRVSGSRHAPIPARLDPLSLAAKGGVVTVLQTWAEDWSEVLGKPLRPWAGSMRQQCDAAVQTLRFNLDWAAREHPAFDDFAHEIERTVRQCRVQLTGEQPAPSRTVACTCGHPLTGIRLRTNSRTCAGCGAEWDWTGLCELARYAAA